MLREKRKSRFRGTTSRQGDVINKINVISCMLEMSGEREEVSGGRGCNFLIERQRKPSLGRCHLLKALKSLSKKYHSELC